MLRLFYVNITGWLKPYANDDESSVGSNFSLREPGCGARKISAARPDKNPTSY